MKLISVLLVLSMEAALAQQYQYLGVPPKADRASLESLDRRQFLSATNIQRIIVLPSMRWQVSGIGPGLLIERFKRVFESSAPIVIPSEELETLVRWEVVQGDVPHPSRIRWSGAYFLTADGDFLTFGEIDEGFVFRTRKTVGVLLTKKAEPDGAVNGTQPIRSATNSTSAAEQHGSSLGKPLSALVGSLDNCVLDVGQAKGAPVLTPAAARYALEHSELLDPTLPEVRQNAFPLIAEVTLRHRDRTNEVVARIDFCGGLGLVHGAGPVSYVFKYRLPEGEDKKR